MIQYLFIDPSSPQDSKQVSMSKTAGNLNLIKTESLVSKKLIRKTILGILVTGY